MHPIHKNAWFRTGLVLRRLSYTCVFPRQAARAGLPPPKSANSTYRSHPYAPLISLISYLSSPDGPLCLRLSVVAVAPTLLGFTLCFLSRTRTKCAERCTFTKQRSIERRVRKGYKSVAYVLIHRYDNTKLGRSDTQRWMKPTVQPHEIRMLQ